jgi:alpha-galactosidase
MVVSTCRTCRSLHLIADNEGKLDMKQYGKKMEDYLESNGEKVTKITINEQELEENYLIDKDGVLTLVPKMFGQVCNLNDI